MYANQVVIAGTTGNYTIDGINFGWMADWWGEVIVSGGTLVYTNPTATTIDIPLQKYCKTTWNGAPQTEYYIQGTGTIDNSGAYPVWTIHYDLKQGDTWIGHLCFTEYGWEQDGFDAVITTDPAGKKVISQTIPKPVRR